MKKILVIAILICMYNFHGSSQILTKEQAFTFAEKLYDVKILSEKGKQYLIEAINTSNFERDKRRNLFHSNTPIQSELSVSNLLYYLSKMFGNDFAYRTGLFHFMNSKMEIMEELGINADELPSDEMNERIDSLVEEKLKSFEGYKIEEAIPLEDSLKESVIGWTMYTPLGKEAEHHLIDNSRSVLGKTLINLLNDLLKIGMIDSLIHSEIIEIIKSSNELVHEHLVLLLTAERVAYYENFEENKAKQIEFLKRLNTANIISNENLARLLESYKDKELKEKYDFIAYCNKAKIFQLKDYPANIQSGYLAIFEDIKKIVPDFHFYNFQAKIVEVKKYRKDEYTELNVAIEFEVDSVKYRNTFYYDYFRKDEEAVSDTLLSVHTDFYQSINKFLTDKNSPYRLYYANQTELNSFRSKNEFGLILLTKEEFMLWGTSNLDYFLSNESYDTTFSTKNIENIMLEYERIGLFDHLSEEELEIGKNRVREIEINSYQGIINCFPNMLVYIDWESGNIDNPYEELTQLLAQASKGKFTPTNILDNFKKDWLAESTKFSFEFKGKKYEATLKMQDDWLDPNFFELIQMSLQANNIDGQFYYCVSDEQTGGQIFLTLAQYEYLKQNQNSLFSLK